MGAVSAQKALQGGETETRELLGGTEEKSPTRGFFTQKGNKNLSWWPDLEIPVSFSGRSSVEEDGLAETATTGASRNRVLSRVILIRF